MSASDETPQRGALARSIDDLFRRQEAADAEAEGGDPGEGDAAEEGGSERLEAVPEAEREADAVEEPTVTFDAGSTTVPEGPASEVVDAEAPDRPGEPPAEGTSQEVSEADAPGNEDLGWGEADAEPPAADAGEAPSPEAAELEREVDAYLRADVAGRPVRRERVLALADELEGRGEAAPVVDAIESLAAVADLGDLGRDDALDLCRELLGPTTATVLCDRLGRLREEDDREARLRRAARLGPDVADAAADLLAESDDWGARRVYIDLLIAMGDEGMRVVTRMLEDPRWYVVRNAVHILGESEEEDVVQHLTAGLGHEDARVRKETLLALAKVGGEDAGMLASNKIDDPEPAVREAAARAIGVLGVERAVRPLLEQLDDEDEPDVQIAIMRALGQLGDPGAVPALEKRAVGGFFGRSPTPVRIAAYRALGAIGTPHARGLVEQAVEDKDAEVRAAATSLVPTDD